VLSAYLPSKTPKVSTKYKKLKIVISHLCHQKLNSHVSLQSTRNKEIFAKRKLKHLEKCKKISLKENIIVLTDLFTGK
jgi:hypothetical protein